MVGGCQRDYLFSIIIFPLSIDPLEQDGATCAACVFVALLAPSCIYLW